MPYMVNNFSFFLLASRIEHISVWNG